jgi:hypothetical protein
MVANYVHSPNLHYICQIHFTKHKFGPNFGFLSLRFGYQNNNLFCGDHSITCSQIKKFM